MAGSSQISNLKNKELKDLSIYEKEEIIKQMDLPEVVKNILLKQMDRLIDYQFNLNDIELNFKANQDQLTENQYAHLLSIAIQEIKKPIQRSTANFLQKAVENYRHGLQTDRYSSKKEARRKDIMPKWLLKERENENEEVEFEENLSADQRTFDEMLKTLKDIRKKKESYVIA